MDILGFAGLLKVAAILLGGVAVGYALRSYYPLALPFESRLVADRTSKDMGAAQLQDLARAANRRAEQAEKQRDEMKREMDSLKSNKQQAERDLADMQIKSMLKAQ